MRETRRISYLTRCCVYCSTKYCAENLKPFSVYSLQNILSKYGLATASGKQSANKIVKKATQKLTLHIYLDTL